MTDLREAHNLRREKKYGEALVVFRKAWDETPSPDTAAAIINCLRGLGDVDEAERFYAAAVTACTANQWLKTEHVWTLYAKYIKPVDIADTTVFMQKAEEIMRLTTDLLPRKLTAFKVTDILARELEPDWNAVRRWLEMIQDVEHEQTTVEPEKKLSDKKKWYFKYTKVLIKLGEYELCRRYCAKAQSIFKTAYFFSHRSAKCLAAMGGYQQARAEYEALLGKHDEWYIHLDLAELLMKIGEYAQADQQVVSALSKCPHMHLKVRALHVWACILEKTAPAHAWLPLALCIRFRRTQGWPVPAELEELAGRIPEPADAVGKSIEDLRRMVDRLIRGRQETFCPDLTGVIKNIREKFGFIRGSDGTDVFFSLGNFTGGQPYIGQRVVYKIRQAYDRKKKRTSAEAFDVRSTERFHGSTMPKNLSIRE